MTKNLGQNQISAGGRTFRFDRCAPQDDSRGKGVNGERSTVNGRGGKARSQDAGDGRLERQGLVILRNEMTKNLGQNQISAGGRTFRFDRCAPQDDSRGKGVNGERCAKTRA